MKTKHIVCNVMMHILENETFLKEVKLFHMVSESIDNKNIHRRCYESKEKINNSDFLLVD